MEKKIRDLVKNHIEDWAKKFSQRHIDDFDNVDGTINKKKHNIFVKKLGKDTMFYSTLIRSFDSSFGNMLEKLGIAIAKIYFKVEEKVEGKIYNEQRDKIAELLEAYKNPEHHTTVSVEDYEKLRDIKSQSYERVSFKSDYYLYDEAKNEHYLIELKIGGDLDNKKARSEKQAIFEHYSILYNKLGKDAKIKCYFATAYNRYGKDPDDWPQSRVKQFFSEEELLIGEKFWNFVCNSENGYNIVKDEYNNNVQTIKEALDKIKNKYLS